MQVGNLEDAKSYKTLANLEAALAKLGFTGHNHRWLRAYTSTGRVTERR